MKTLLLSISYAIFILSTPLLASEPVCQDYDKYCINIGIEDHLMLKHQGCDLCYVIELNGVGSFASGSIPIKNLPTVLFSISSHYASLGKPLNVRIIKAQIVPKGECEKEVAQLHAVNDCKLTEFSTIAGVSRFVTLNQISANANFTCRVK